MSATEKQISTKEKKVDAKLKEVDAKLKEVEIKRKEIKKEADKLKEISSKAKQSAAEFRKELKKALNTALVAAFSFLIALSWRDVITEYVNKATSISPVQGLLVSAIIVTIISVIGIFAVTKILTEKTG